MSLDDLRTWSTEELLNEREVLVENIDEYQCFGKNDLRMLNMITYELLRRREGEDD